MQWSEDKIQYIREHPEMTYMQLASQFGVSIANICQQVRKHNLRPKNDWARKLVMEYVIEKGDATIAELMELTGKNQKAVTMLTIRIRKQDRHFLAEKGRLLYEP